MQCCSRGYRAIRFQDLDAPLQAPPYIGALLLEHRWGRSIGGHGRTLGRLVVATGRRRTWCGGIGVAVVRRGRLPIGHVAHLCEGDISMIMSDR